MPAFIPSKNHDRLNRREFAPEMVTGWCMVNPHHRSVTVWPGTSVVCDSGAFQESDMLARLTPAASLERQLVFEASCTRDGRRRFPDGFAAIVTYDMLVGVDEALVDGVRVKRRGTEETAAAAVEATLSSAIYYHTQRHRVAGAIAYAAQGATLRQYLACVRTILPLLRPGRDWLALGGFCIIGMQTSLKPLFIEVCRAVAPMCVSAGVHRVHVLGVCAADVLAVAAAVFADHDILFTTDSSSIEVNSIMGKEWREENMVGGGSPWKKIHDKAAKSAGRYNPATLAMENIARFFQVVRRSRQRFEPFRSTVPGRFVVRRNMEIFKQFRFEAAHRLPHVPVGHKCARLHGHSYFVEVHVAGGIGADTGWVIDFADIAAAWQPLHAMLDHNYLNDIEGLDNPTSELLARWIWRRLVSALPLLSQVVVRETCMSGCSFRGEPST